MFYGVQHTGFTVSDMERSLAFYRDTLGLKVEVDTTFSGEGVSKLVGVPDVDLRVVLLRVGEARIELLHYRNADIEVYHPRNCDVGAAHASLLVDNIHVMYADLVKQGVEFNDPPICHTEGPLRGWICAYFKDPDGYTLELHQVTPPV